MLDKSIPYKEILMVRSAADALPERKALPEGYTARLFRPGDETGWASVETSVGEFDNVGDGLRYFHREFTPHLADVQQRCTRSVTRPAVLSLRQRHGGACFSKTASA